jgi:hypothetical protein
MNQPFYEKALAIKGLISYRYKGRYGWIMIGAHNHADALREAKRSTDESIIIENLQVWDEAKSCYIGASENANSVPFYVDPVHSKEKTLADHAEEWAKEKGEEVPVRDSIEWSEMYQRWIEFAFRPVSAASTLGRLGGLAKSPTKSISSAKNGKKGGRPKQEVVMEDADDLFV